MTTNALEVVGVSVHFDGLVAVDDVSMAVPAGGRHGILGPNGAGKTTLFDAITGLTPVAGGRVILDGEDVTALGASTRARAGLARTFQIITLMESLTAFENVMLGAFVRAHEANSWWRASETSPETVARTHAVMEDLGLSHVAGERVNELSYGDRRRIDIAMALAANPSVLLLDEPAAGLSIKERANLVDLLASISSEVTVVVIEHDVEVIFSVVDTMTVLNRGSVVVDGTVDEVKADPLVEEIYLGAR